MFSVRAKALSAPALIAFVLALPAAPAADVLAADPSATPAPVSDSEPSPAPDPADYVVEQVRLPSCTTASASVTISWHGHTTEVAVGLIGDGTNEASQEQVEPGTNLTLVGDPLEPGQSVDYRIVTSFLDDHSGVTVLQEFTASRPRAEQCTEPATAGSAGPAPRGAGPAAQNDEAARIDEPAVLPSTGSRFVPILGLLGVVLVASGVSLVLLLRRRHSVGS